MRKNCMQQIAGETKKQSLLDPKGCAGVLDIVRLFFAICVVAIHTHAQDGLPQAPAFWITQGILRMAVPFFFVTSGFFLGRKIDGQGQDVLAVLSRYTRRLLPILLLAGGANGALELFTQRLVYHKGLRYLAGDFIRHVLFYPYGAMWFVQACIVGAWMLYPFLKRKKNGLALLAGGVLYSWALLCNTYYFLAQKVGWDSAADSFLDWFLSARNGVFVGFFFLSLGIGTWKWYRAGRGRNARYRFLACAAALYAAEIYLTQGCAYRDDRALYLTHILLAPALILCLADSRLPVPARLAHGFRRASAWLYVSHRFLYELGGLVCLLVYRMQWQGAGAFTAVLAASALGFLALEGWRRTRKRARAALSLFAAVGMPVLICLFLFLEFRDHKIWEFSAYGVITDKAGTSCTGSFDQGEVVLENTRSGKLVPYGADGLSFYYTKLDAGRDNFVLSALVTVDSWTLTNGEDDGFGLMVSDAVGKHGDNTDFWNNGYQAAVTKVEYRWNPETKKASNVGDPVIMRLGIGAREKSGSTEPYPEDAQKAAHMQKVTTCTLEESQGQKGPGTYNLIGNGTPIAEPGGKQHLPAGTVGEEEQLTSVRLEICRDNTGYRIRYLEEDGTVHEKLFYDLTGEKLTAIDPDHIYVGFFVTRQAKVSFREMKLTVTNRKTDPAAEEILPEVLEPDYRVISSHTANTAAYELIFETNWDGALSVREENGAWLVTDRALKAGEQFPISCRLKEGENRYEIVFCPTPGEAAGRVLSDVSRAVFWHTVSWKKIGDGKGNIYTAPDPDLQGPGTGTKDSPISLAEAVQYAAPGQRILLAQGEYLLSEPLTIERGHDGTVSDPVCLMSDPANTQSPILNFQRKCKGLTLSADHWVLEGFACTGSAVNEYGLHLTGSHNRLEDLQLYRNGNTGLHISSLSLWDEKAQWPSDNLIRNCTSYGNCDDAYEDADGFACQFTAGPGNVFDGCCAHHNADDGWDFYAKVWLDVLGPVTLRNCTAYCNGYLEDGRPAGNGNGFKLGGDGMPGGHRLENCLSYENKRDGFTSNSCPDVTLIDCTATDNGECNLRLYTKNRKNTSYLVQGFCSRRTEGKTGKSDVLQGCGTQKAENLYREDNYYWDATRQAAINSKGERKGSIPFLLGD